MKIDNEFTVRVPIAEAWEVLTDLEGIAPCLPGALLTGVEGEDFKGKVKIKVGPVISEYSGIAKFIQKDDTTYRAVIDAKGKDSRGNGNAAAVISAQLRAAGDGTVVSVETDLNITGKIAQFGSAMMKEVSAKLLGQFADNLETKLLAPTEPTPDATTATAPDVVPESSAAEPSVVVDEVAAEAAPRPFAQATEPEPLDLLAIAGSSITKRLIPPLVAIAAVIAIIGYRRRTR